MRLDVKDVTVRFGGVAAVDGVSLAAEPGEITGLIGPNGAGKTTLFNVVTGLLRPNAGRVYLGSEDITHRGTHQRARRGVARTFQRLEAFGSLSVWENVLVAAENRRGRRRRSANRVVRELVEAVGLAPYADTRADTVPTGIARLLELARALATDPKVLLLDEPSSGLSAAETASFGELLSGLADEGRTVLLVEHDMELIMNVCDRIHVLDRGRVIASGPPAAVRADEAVQKAYLGQTEEPDGAGPHVDDPTVDLTAALAPGALGPDGRAPDGVGPDGLGPDGLGPDGLGPDGLGPDGMGLDGRAPDGLGPDGRATAGMGPDGRAPQSLGPDERAPDLWTGGERP